MTRRLCSTIRIAVVQRRSQGLALRISGSGFREIAEAMDTGNAGARLTWRT